MSYQAGETIICSITVKSNTGTLTDPATSMNIKIDQMSPQYVSKVTSVGMTKDSTGTYHYDCQTSGYSAGNYFITYTATDGTRITVETDTFLVE